MVMPNYFQEQQVGQQGQLLTPLNVFRGASFSVATTASGADVSGGGPTIYQVSSPVTVRVLNLEIKNNDNNWIEVEFRDGGFAGGRVLGPYRIEAFGQMTRDYNMLIGRTFTSSIYAVVLSGGGANPTSNGAKIDISYFTERADYRE